MDDTVILVKTKQEAKEILKKIEIFLKENLDLELNPVGNERNIKTKIVNDSKF